MKVYKRPLILFMLLSLAGCAVGAGFIAGTAMGIVGYKYYEGKLIVIYQAPFMDTWDATLRTLKRIKIKIKSSRHGLTSGNIKAVGLDNEPINISFKYISSQETQVGIRVGLLGDKKASSTIKEEIRKELFER